MTRFAAVILTMLLPAFGQHIPGYNYDEAKIPPHTVLDPLRTSAGKAVTTAKQWQGERRPEIVRLFEENVFGKTPEAAKHAGMRARVIERDEHALNGTAIREQIELTFAPAKGITAPETAAHSLRLLLYLPAGSKNSPVVLGPNFSGNQSVVDDPGIQPTPVWTKPKGATELQSSAPAKATRGKATEAWQVKLLLSRGYGLATFYYGDLEPDFKDSSAYSVRRLYSTAGDLQKPDAWGALAAWAWGLERCLDYLTHHAGVDARYIAVTGHSRLGKAADWAAAQDPRFAAVLSTESGHGGQTIQRRALGETVAHLQHSFPYWFAPAYATWVDRDRDIPADGNLLLALIAPRPLYVASAVQDEWSDPHGEFLAAQSAGAVYRLLGSSALDASTPMPAIDEAVGLHTHVAYHERAGRHDVTRFDWQHYLDFLDICWGTPEGVR